MKKHKIKYHDVSSAAYKELLAYMKKADGVKVDAFATNDNLKCSITGENTEINMILWPDSKVLEVEYAKIPKGLEAYYWGHGYQRLNLISEQLNKKNRR